MDENAWDITDAKLHVQMCKTLSSIYLNILSIFPSLEASKPRSRSGIQALCALNISLEKTKSILQQCSESSKLYLAVTGESIATKFERVRISLLEGLKRVGDSVPQVINFEISEIVAKLENAVFVLDPLEKQAGEEIISLIQQRRKSDTEIESFHQIAVKLEITSSRAALSERRALKKVLERARTEEDAKKESLILYLLHLVKKYSKSFRSEMDENDSQSSTPCSPTIYSDSISNGRSSFDSKSNGIRSGNMLTLPEELRCPISLQIMYDPVIIASGQTYERICIEKWFNDGHETCPKTQQKLSHMCLTPNFCVKGLITNWCDQYGVPAPSAPPEYHSQQNWRVSNQDSVEFEPKSAYKFSDVTLLEELLYDLNYDDDFRNKLKTVERLRILLKEDEDARSVLGGQGLVEALMNFIEVAIQAKDEHAEEVGAMALFNLTVRNNRNKEMMLQNGAMKLLETMIRQPTSHASATALYLSLSSLHKAKSAIVSSEGAKFLIRNLEKRESQCRTDSLHALYNLTSSSSCIPKLVSAGIVGGLEWVLGRGEAEKAISVLTNVAGSSQGRSEMVASGAVIGGLAGLLEAGEEAEQEQAGACLLALCEGSEECIEMALQEGVIPALVSMTVNGTRRGREKAQRLLMLFREQRHKGQGQGHSHSHLHDLPSTSHLSFSADSASIRKISSVKRVTKALTFFRKSKSFSVYNF